MTIAYLPASYLALLTNLSRHSGTWMSKHLFDLGLTRNAIDQFSTNLMCTMAGKIRIGAMSFGGHKGVWLQSVDHTNFRALCADINPEDSKEVRQ